MENMAISFVEVTVGRLGTVGMVGTWYDWLATCVYVARFFPLWTRVVTHPITSGSGRCLLSITFRD